MTCIGGEGWGEPQLLPPPGNSQSDYTSQGVVLVQNDGVTEEEGWYLEQIKVTKVTGREKSWLFVCQNWLSLHEGDCQARRQIFCQQSSQTG